MRYTSLAPSAQVAYSDLLTSLFSSAIPDRGISYFTRTVKGRDYWYMQHVVGNRKRSRYIGPDTAEIRQLIDKCKHRQADDGQQRTDREQLVAICSAAGLHSLTTAEARAELVLWFRQEWQLNGPKYNRWRRRDLFQACLAVGEIDAAGIAEARTNDTWLHVLCGGVTTTQEIEALLNAGAMTVINAANANGDTPLHAYARRSYHSRGSQPNAKGLRLLLESGADPTLRNNAGQTPADVTRERKFQRRDTVQAQREMLEMLDAAAPWPCA